jgi:hypothetical protein
MMRTLRSVGLAMLAELGTAPDAIERDTFGSEWTEADGVITRTFYSPTIPMAPGQIIMRDDIAMGLVDEPAALVNIASDLVDEHGASVPLSQAYMHHWLLNGRSDRNHLGIPWVARGLQEAVRYHGRRRRAVASHAPSVGSAPDAARHAPALARVPPPHGLL